MVTIKDLETFFDIGWNRHDVDVLMAFMADDCVFEGATGPEVCGTRYQGRERVCEAFARIFAAFRGTTTDGKRIEVNGCDLFTFRGGKIAVKSSYLKARSA